MMTDGADRDILTVGASRLKSSLAAQALETKAAAASEQAKVANQRADNYMLAVVLFAAALFFAGISTKLRSVGARATTLGIGCILFAATAIWLATMPAQVTV
jgi:hypothetical protein